MIFVILPLLKNFSLRTILVKDKVDEYFMTIFIEPIFVFSFELTGSQFGQLVWLPTIQSLVIRKHPHL
jgi:hypothetical protein